MSKREPRVQPHLKLKTKKNNSSNCVECLTQLKYYHYHETIKVAGLDVFITLLKALAVLHYWVCFHLWWWEAYGDNKKQTLVNKSQVIVRKLIRFHCLCMINRRYQLDGLGGLVWFSVIRFEYYAHPLSFCCWYWTVMILFCQQQKKKEITMN